jgi:hypothetical protein
VSPGPVRDWWRLAIPLAWLALSTPSTAQIIGIKTSRLAQGDQLSFFPSANLSLGGLAIALDDTLLDPFANPAKAARARHSQFFSSPTFYSVSRDNGGGRTLPVGAFGRTGNSFGGVALVAQHLSSGRAPSFAVLEGDVRTGGIGFPPPAFDTSHTNQYAFLLAGHTWPRRVSLAASVLLSGLDALDGSERLYAGSSGVQQSGHATDVRLGALKEWDGGRSLDAVVLYNRSGVNHEVSYTDLVWDPARRTMAQQRRLENDASRANTWGMQVQYTHPVSDSGWRVGALVAGNRSSRPSLPNDAVLGMAQDEGRATSLDVGAGLSKVKRGSTVGLDAIYEPIWSRSWASDRPSGSRTIDNDLRFSNAIVRAGIGQEIALASQRALAFQGGLELRSIDYRLDQDDLLQHTSRRERDQWVEWTRTWGASLRLSKLTLQYRGRLTTGVARPEASVVFPFGVADALPSTRPAFFSVDPSLTMRDVRVVAHQVSVTLPIR